MPSHHGRDRGDEPPRHPPSTVLTDWESALPPKMRQHYKSLTIFQLYNKLQGPIPVQFDLEGETFYAVGEYSDHYVRYIGSLIRQLIPPYFWSWKVVRCTRGATSTSPLTGRGKKPKFNSIFLKGIFLIKIL